MPVGSETGAWRVQFDDLAGEQRSTLDGVRWLMATRTLSSTRADGQCIVEPAVLTFEVRRTGEDLREVRRGEVRRRGHALVPSVIVRDVSQGQLVTIGHR